MFKSDHFNVSDERPRPQNSHRSVQIVTAFRISVMICFLWISGQITPHFQVALGRHEKEDNGFRWSRVTPSKQLTYVNCFGDFQCARLDVPLNWKSTDHEGGARAAIAIVKLPAKVPVTDQRYGGVILMNPGGPGESGIHQVVSGGKHVQTIVDSAISPDVQTSFHSEKYYDILGFDPRGVNNTTPRLKCYPDAFNQQSWILRLNDYGVLYDSDSVLGLEWAKAEALARSCSPDNEEFDMSRFVNTAQVVEDMLEIVERHGEWRESEAERLQKVSRFSTTPTEEIRSRTKWYRGHEKLQYWGVSYGSNLGQTFAAMHPDRVHRLVIDGILNADDYYNGEWLANIQDSDAIVTKFSEYCFEAGPFKCPLHTGTSGKDVEARVTKILIGLKTNPIPVPGSVEPPRGPEIVTYGDVMLGLLTAMFFPFTYAEPFFDLLSETEKRNGTKIANIKQANIQAVELTSACRREGPFSAPCISANYISGFGPGNTVECMDRYGGKGRNITKVEFMEYFRVLQGQGKWMSTSWARHKFSCVGMTALPAWSFEELIQGNTSHPLLIIGNTHDTVTPIRNAHRAATKFPGSVVLHQDSEGHCSASNPSICTAHAVRTYFQTGILPKPGTICLPEWRPFVGCVHKDENGDCRKLNEEDEKIWDALVGLTDYNK